MKIVDNWKDHEELYWTVEISKGKFVDVKQTETGFIYIMQNNDGLEIYDKDGNTYDELTKELEDEIIDLIEREI